jgi:DegV family protein with EDD domain
MSDYRVITDATCDIDPALAEAHHIQVIPMEVILDDKTFYHYADFRNYPAKDYYQKLREGAKSHTSAINPQTYIDTFTPVLKGGEDILYLCFSSGLSSTYQSSVLAVSQLRDEFPDRKIYTIDTLCACGGEGFLVYYTALNHEQGMSIEDNAAWADKEKMHVAHWFTVSDLFFLKRGGRVSAATAIAGSALQIKPLMHVDNEGHLIAVGKVHGRKASVRAMFEKMKATIVHPEGQTVMISQADCMEDALTLKQMILESLPVKEVIISTIGPVVGCHGGPTMLTLFFWATER